MSRLEALRRYIETRANVRKTRERSRFHVGRAFAMATGSIVAMGAGAVVGIITGDLHLGLVIGGAGAGVGTVSGAQLHGFAWDRRRERLLEAGTSHAQLMLVEDERSQRLDEIDQMKVKEVDRERLRLEADAEYCEHRKKLRGYATDSTKQPALAPAEDEIAARKKLGSGSGS